MTSTLSPTPASPAEPPRRRRLGSGLRFVALLAGAVVLGLLVVRVAADLFRPHLYAGTVLQSPTPAPSMDDLVLGNGEPMDMAMFEGDVVLLFFGYTQCPDICPTTLATVARVHDGLDTEDEARVHVVMVSVDPDHDDLDRLQTYVSSFDEDFLGLGGEAQAIDRAAAQYGIYYAINEADEHGRYTIDHTASVLGIGPDGHLRVVWGPDVDSAALQADVEALLDS